MTSLGWHCWLHTVPCLLHLQYGFLRHIYLHRQRSTLSTLLEEDTSDSSYIISSITSNGDMTFPSDMAGSGEGSVPVKTKWLRTRIICIPYLRAFGLSGDLTLSCVLTLSRVLQGWSKLHLLSRTGREKIILFTSSGRLDPKPTNFFVICQPFQ